MRITIVYNEDEIAFNVATSAVRKYLLNPSVKVVVVENDRYLIRHCRNTRTYEVISADSIQQHFSR